MNTLCMNRLRKKFPLPVKAETCPPGGLARVANRGLKDVDFSWKHWGMAAGGFLLFIAPSLLWAKVNVVTTTTDLAALTQAIGGDLVSVHSIAKGYQDPHFVDAKPSYLLKLKKADLFIQVGLELEIGWAPGLLTRARNPKIMPGTAGFLNASQDIKVLEKPTDPIDRSMGDAHPLGNPHIWLDPHNGLTIARSIAHTLGELKPSKASLIEKNLLEFERALIQKQQDWGKWAGKHRQIKAIAYHNSWPYFAKAFGIDILNFIEPKPGIPPSPSHVKYIVDLMKAKHIKLIFLEPYFDRKLPDKIARDTGARVLVLAPSVGANAQIKTYFELIDYDVNQLKEALGGGL